MVGVETLSAGDVSAASDALREAGATAIAAHWIEADKAIDYSFDLADARLARNALEAAAPDCDVVVQQAAHRMRKLLIADMDSTMITIECIDELADYAGIKEQVAAVTEAAMRGELDFEAALDARVRLLKGLDESVIERALNERVEIMPGAVTLISTLKVHGAHTVLISGGFTAFAEPVGRMIGFDEVIANRLGIEAGQLSGTVDRPIVTAAVKRATLAARAETRGLALADCLAVGDGANDIPMIELAGLGVAYHAKPKTFAAADAAIRHGDLSVLLYAAGLPRAQWVQPTSR